MGVYIMGQPDYSHEKLVGSDHSTSRVLGSRLVLGLAIEKRKLERHLHDTILQYMAAINLALQVLPAKLQVEYDGVLGEAQLAVQNAFREIREVSRQLNPPQLLDGAFLDALNLLFQNARHARGMRAELSTSKGDLAPPLTTKIVLFGFVETMLSIATRESTMYVNLEEIEEKISMTVQLHRNQKVDDRLLPDLQLIETEVLLLGGSLQLKGETNHSTSVTVTLPSLTPPRTEKLDPPDNLCV